MIDRLDKNGDLIKVGDLLYNSANGKTYRVVFSNDILAYGIIDESGMFDFMSDWLEYEWEIKSASD
jgi:hypothetical protein